tara:strand:+ start:102 stop:1511 length:1410 start_codon:yes stop_codon:yes gene_type:complete
MQVNIKQVRSDLQELLDQNGESSFPRLKALYLKDIEITDADGNPLDAEAVDVEISLPVEAEVNEDAIDPDEEAKQMEDEDEEETAKSLSATDIAGIVRKELARTNTRKPVSQVRVGSTKGMTKVGSIKHLTDDETAYRFGRWVAACNGHTKSMVWCKDYGVRIKTHQETVNSAGGYLVPDEFSDQLISLREEYGVVRNNATIVPMASDVKRIPRRTDTMTAYWVGESASITASDQTFDQVNLVAKKLAARTKISNELNEDAMINLGDTLAGEIAYAFAKSEDDAAFLGDGTSTYGGCVGLKTNVLAGGTVQASNRAVASVTMADITKLMAALPHYADTANTKFYMHKQTFGEILMRLASNASGASIADVYNTKRVPSFLGYEVVFTQSMTKAASGSFTQDDHMIYFGDLSQAVYLGDRRQTTMAFSDSADSAFEQDEISVRGTERISLVATNLGTAAAAGSVVVLDAPA